MACPGIHLRGVGGAVLAHKLAPLNHEQRSDPGLCRDS